MPDRIIVAGYSVGEVAAWGVAGLFGMTDTLDLVARRAEAMDAASLPGDGLLFIRGLSPDDVDRLCNRYEAAVAIINPGDDFVLGDGRAALHAIPKGAKVMNAVKVIDLPVDVASHTRRIVATSAAFGESLRLASVIFPPAGGTRLLSGIDGAPVIRVDAGLDKLAAQISQTAQWRAACKPAWKPTPRPFWSWGRGMH